MIDSTSSPNSSSSASSFAESELLEHLFTTTWGGPHGPTTLRLGGYGKDIDWTLVVPSITRPVWEPPALEVLDVFETAFWEDREKELAKAVSNITIRTEMLDLHMLFFVIGRYAVWAKQTGRNAIEVADEERERFYEGLLQELLLEFSEVTREIFVLLKDHAPDIFTTFMEAERNDYKDEKEETGSYWKAEGRNMFTLRPVDESSDASSITASAECVSETTSQISDWINDIAGLQELFTDWMDNVFNLDTLFNEADDLSEAAIEPQLTSPDNPVVRARDRVHMRVNPGVLASRVSAPLPPFSLQTFNQTTASTWKTQPNQPSEPLHSPETSKESEDLINLELLATPSISTSEARASDNLIDLDTAITDNQSPSITLNAILKATGLNEMSDIDTLLS